MIARITAALKIPAFRLTVVCLFCASICIFQVGCRKTLSSAGPSRLWPKYIQRQSDLAWTEQGFCESARHVACKTSDYQAGFNQGFYETAYHRIQPAGPCDYQNPPIPSRIAKRLQHTTSPAVIQGYHHGSHIASASTIAGFHPGDAPLPGVSRVYTKR